MRSVPTARPGMAPSQKSCAVVNWKPIWGRRTTTALIKNHVLKERTRHSVVIVRVRQAIWLPSFFQNEWSSGVHVLIHVVAPLMPHLPKRLLGFRQTNALLSPTSVQLG